MADLKFLCFLAFEVFSALVKDFPKQSQMCFDGCKFLQPCLRPELSLTL